MYTKIRFNYQIEHRLFEYVNTREILANGMDLIVTKGRQRISAFKTWYNSPKIRNLKLCILLSLNVFFNFLTLIRINYLCSKMCTYLVTIFLSEWGYCV